MRDKKNLVAQDASKSAFEMGLEARNSSIDEIESAIKSKIENDEAFQAKDFEDYLKIAGDLEAKNHSGQTMLHIACNLGIVKFVEFLLGKGANENETDNCRKTPMHYARKINCKEVRSEIMGLLLKTSEVLEFNRSGGSRLSQTVVEEEVVAANCQPQSTIYYTSTESVKRTPSPPPQKKPRI